MSSDQVTSEELATASAQLDTGCKEIDSQLAAMGHLVQSLVGGDWQGAASSVFDGLCQQWNTSAANLREAMDGISRLLANAAATCPSIEKQAEPSLPV